MLTRITYHVRVNSGAVRMFTAYVDNVFNHTEIFYGIVIDDQMNRVFDDSGTDRQLMMEDVEEFVNTLGIVINRFVG